MIIISISVIFLLIFISQSTFAQQYCIDQSSYNQWLCNNEKGARQACYAPPLVGQFPDYNSCEIKRRSTLPYDYRYQSMTRCVPCGPAEPSNRPSPGGQIRDQEREEIERVIKEAQQAALEEKIEREQYIAKLKQEREQQSKEFKEMAKNLSNNIKLSSAPMSSIQIEHYMKTFEQAYCIAHASLRAAELAMRGNFEISKKLMTEIELARTQSGSGFDNFLARDDIKCPKNLVIKIPDVYASIEDDPQYLKFTEFAKKVQIMIPKIENLYEKLSEVKDIKTQKKEQIKEIKEQIKTLEQQKRKAKTPEEKAQISDILSRTLSLERQTAVELQKVLKEEQKLIHEKQAIEKELDRLGGEIGNEKK